MISRLTLLIVLCAPAWAEVSGRLGVAADPALATVKPLTEGRRLIRLPSLEFELNIDAECTADSVPKSVSISIADTRKTLNGDELQDINGGAVPFAIPARQVSPVAVDGFCAEDGNGNQLLVRDAVTAHLSLRCTNEEKESITYTSQGLDVMLECNVPEETDQPESEIAR
jgi:stage V sporulation protein SpoVS